MDDNAFCAELELAETAIEGDAEAGKTISYLILSDGLKATLMKRGASHDEAKEIQSELSKGCFSSAPERGQLYGLLAKYSGKASLEAYFGRVALNRLISLKRKKKAEVVSIDENDLVSDSSSFSQRDDFFKEDEVIDLLRNALRRAFASVDQEKLVILRLVQSYRLSQKQVGMVWGYSESKISRILSGLTEELREQILHAVKKRDPWLNLEWEDFLSLCDESIDLFDYAH